MSKRLTLLLEYFHKNNQNEIKWAMILGPLNEYPSSYSLSKEYLFQVLTNEGSPSKCETGRYLDDSMNLVLPTHRLKSISSKYWQREKPHPMIFLGYRIGYHFPLYRVYQLKLSTPNFPNWFERELKTR